MSNPPSLDPRETSPEHGVTPTAPSKAASEPIGWQDSTRELPVAASSLSGDEVTPHPPVATANTTPVRPPVEMLLEPVDVAQADYLAPTMNEPAPVRQATAQQEPAKADPVAVAAAKAAPSGPVPAKPVPAKPVSDASPVTRPAVTRADMPTPVKHRPNEADIDAILAHDDASFVPQAYAPATDPGATATQTQAIDTAATVPHRQSVLPPGASTTTAPLQGTPTQAPAPPTPPTSVPATTDSSAPAASERKLHIPTRTLPSGPPSLAELDFEAADPIPPAPTPPGFGRHFWGALVGLVLTPVAFCFVVWGAAMPTKPGKPLDSLSLGLTIIGGLLFLAVTLLGRWTPAVPLAGAIGWGIGVGIAFLAFPLQMVNLVVDLFNSQSVPAFVRDFVSASQQGQLLTMGLLLLGAGLATGLARRAGRRYGDMAARHQLREKASPEES